MTSAGGGGAFNPAWQAVTCSKCRRRFRCTPADDYYQFTNATDGLCQACMIGDTPMRTVIVTLRREDDHESRNT